MVSTALLAWRSERAARLDRLGSAHSAVGGTGPGRRWLTEELNHALVLRLAAEFQGFARDLHTEAAAAIAASLGAGVNQRDDALLGAFTMTRRLDRGNAGPDVLRHDFALFGLDLRIAIPQRFPGKASQWQHRLALLNDARNGLAHADLGKVERVAAAGWPLTLRSARRWRGTLETVATALDEVTLTHLGQVFGIERW